MARFYEKLKLITWKNLIIRKRHYIKTAFEIFIPILLFFLVAFARSKIPDISGQYVNETKYFNKESIQEFYKEFPPTTIYYAPDNSFTQNIIEKVEKKLLIQPSKVFGFPSEEILLNNYTEMNFNDDNIFDFENRITIILFSNETNFNNPTKFKYKIRPSHGTWDTKNVFPQFLTPGPMDSYLSYKLTGFIGLQSAIDTSYYELVSKKTIDVDFTMQPFPYPPYFNDFGFSIIYRNLLPLVTVLSFYLFCPSLIKNIIEEKSTGIKELMKMMGLQPWMLWLGWLIHSLVANLPAIIIITFLMKLPLNADTGAMIPFCNSIIYFIFMLLYFMSCVFFCFAICSLFNRPTLAAIAGSLAHLFSYTLFVNATQDPKMSFSLKLVMSLLPNIAMTFGYKSLADWESKNVGLKFSNLFTPGNGSSDELSMGIIFFMFIVDILLYTFITWYIDSIKPGNYGLAKPWYFIFTKAFWCPTNIEHVHERDGLLENATYIETPSSNLVPGIKIRNLHKSFGNKVAVDGLTMDIYQKEITALLGHNGAGKTTTMSIITGLYSPSNGTAYINGYDIRTNLDEIRDSLGLCPQHNMLFTELNVYEHLLFFAKLKGCSNNEAEMEANQLLEKLNLTSKKYEMSEKLSGGMKRKLSLGISLIGKTKVLILDEPTSGMDPEARRQIWDLLLSMRGERTIIITTHFMEEADVLGDRIAIMDHGRLQCYGSSLFLKKLYGTGYQLQFLKGPKSDLNQITKIIQNIMPDASFKTQNGAFVTYLIPTKDNLLISKLFNELERRKHEIDIDSVGLSLTTLEEVFLRVGELASKKTETYNDQGDQTSSSISETSEDLEALKKTKLKNIDLLIRQFNALTFKRALYSHRQLILLLTQILIPIGLILLAMYWSKPNRSSDDGIEFKFDLKKYGENEIFYSSEKGIPEEMSKNYLLQAPEKYFKYVGGNVSETLIEVGKKNIIEFRELLIVATEFMNIANKISVNAMYSTIALHSMPISFNMVINSALKLLNSAYSIETSIQPIEKKTKQDFANLELLSMVQVIIYWWLVIPIGLLFLVTTFVHFPLTEYVAKTKQLQYMAGTHFSIYWLTCFICDFVLYLGIMLVILIIIAVFDPNGFSGASELFIIFLLLFLFGIVGILQSYVVSFVKKTVASAFTFVLITCTILSVIATPAVIVMMQSEHDPWMTIGEILKYVLGFLPYFLLTHALFLFSYNVLEHNNCRLKPPEVLKFTCQYEPNNTCCVSQKDCTEGYCTNLSTYLSGEKSIAGDLILFIYAGIVWIVILILFEKNIISSIYEKIITSIYGGISFTDRTENDVIKEHDRVDGQMVSRKDKEDVLLVQNLEKKFKSFLAVRGLSFGVKHNECFGLLGVNGAGKTTTFRMLTGDEIPSSGSAIINGVYDMYRNKPEYLAQIGYCPQFDAINESLTGREMLELFGQLRGLTPKCVKHETNKFLNLLGLTEYADRLSGTYSGGNKRKLSAALALIADPSLVLLDEPTSGVDPISRRNLWDVLTKVKKQGMSIVLTSHSMEECEALCDRLAIMVNGQFKCLGEIQYLKHKYGQGYTLQIKLKNDATQNEIKLLKEQLESRFLCELKDEHVGFLLYHIKPEGVSWQILFDNMENIKSDSGGTVEDYTISETTLEQVFLAFAKLQKNYFSSNKKTCFCF